ncbi:MAG TPA: DNA-binding protein [Prevotella sp.]|jgi:excisionase family DNA binding protein|nr:DNA-binding protein [Prevotella sp.]
MEEKEEEKGINMVMLPKDAWQDMASTLKEIKDVLETKKAEEVNNEWIGSAEARKMLGVSPKTWQNYRDNRIIPFTQFGRKISVKRSDLEAFMEAHYIKSEN